MKFVQRMILIFLVLGLTACSTNSPQLVNNKSKLDNEIKNNIDHELVELSAIQKCVNDGEIKQAKIIFEEFHTGFHGIIYPNITSKKGKKFADNIHNSCDQLEDALNNNKDKQTINRIIKVNIDNLKEIESIV